MADVPFLRPEARAALRRWRETAVAVAVVCGGIAIAGLGGWFYRPLGALVAGAGVAFCLVALRRLRFADASPGPGLVEVTEGEIAYFGPEGGGFVAVREIAELALVHRSGMPFWRIRPDAGTALVVPVGAAGAAGLFDALAGLPGLDPARLVAAADDDGGPDRVLWRRPRGRLAALT